MNRFRICSLAAFLIYGPGALILVSGCESDDKKEPPPVVERPEPVPNPLPRYLRGTIRYEAELRGYRPTFVSGYGIVVGLQGTGSADTPIPIRAAIEREAARLMDDTRVTPDQPVSIEDLLNSKDTSVVFVEGSIPPGAPAGTRFDVKVSSLPSTSTTSLERGRLWTVQLTNGIARPTGPMRDPVAMARGDVLINPFVSFRAPDRTASDSTLSGADEGADLLLPDPDLTPAGDAETLEAPGQSPDDAASVEDFEPPPAEDPETLERGDADVNRRVGRILNGGVTTEDMPLVIYLTNPNFSRARAITDAINQRFPRDSARGQLRPTAVPVQGRSDEQIQIFVPPAWSDRTDDFVQVLMHTPIQRAAVDQYANNLAVWVRENPVDAPEISWIWVGIGEPSLPSIQSLYTYTEIIPRIAALKAGAKLGDPLALRPLAEVAANAESTIRINAISLLAELSQGQASVRVGAALRPLLDDPDLSVRLAAFEALEKIRDPGIRRYSTGEIDGFDLCLVPSERPMIYVTQQKEPRIVVFGEKLEVARPVIASAWNDRLLVIGASSGEPLRVFYRKVGDLEGKTFEVPPDLLSFIRFLGAAAKPHSGIPGLGLTYAETLSALYALNQENAISAPLVAERDQLTARILSGRRGERPAARPETELPARPDQSASPDNGAADENAGDEPATEDR